MRSGLDTASEASCTMIEAIPSAPPSPFGLTVCISECRWATVGIADKCEPDFSSPDSAAGVPAAVLGAEPGTLSHIPSGEHHSKTVRIFQ